MCRLVAVVSSVPAEFTVSLHDAPRSLSKLSRDHRDGWGIAVYEGTGVAPGWRIHRGLEPAHDDLRFHQLAEAERGELLVAHVRRKTVGPLTPENTHPFHHGRWVFAHNGTIDDLGWIREGTSAARLAAVGGTTDSELFFAWLLTRMDEAGLADAPIDHRMDDLLARCMGDVRAREGAGSINFLLTDGDVLYAHRFGRTLFLLERRPGDPVRLVRESSEGVAISTRWTSRRHALLVASEALTEEPWEPVEEGDLLRIDRGAVLTHRFLR